MRLLLFSLPRVALSLNPRLCRLHLSDVFPRWYFARVMQVTSFRCVPSVVYCPGYASYIFQMFSSSKYVVPVMLIISFRCLPPIPLLKNTGSAVYLNCTLVMIQFYIQRLKPSVSLDDVLTDIRFRDLFLLFDDSFARRLCPRIWQLFR